MSSQISAPPDRAPSDRAFGSGRWRYREYGRRDARLDLLRGYAVFAMLCDHAANISWFSPFTGGNRFVVSAAEAFVFLAGLVIGMVYGGRMRRDGWVAAAESILRRVVVLYAATVGLTLLFVVLFQFTSLRLWLDRDYGLGLTDPVELLIGTLTLHYTYHGTDILWMYTILIATAPLLLLALRDGHAVPVVVGSWLLWLAYQWYPSQATVPWMATNVNYFPVSAWQVIFVNGLVIGYYRDAVSRVLARVPIHLVLAVFGLGMAFLILVQRGHNTGRLAGWPIVGHLAGEWYLLLFDKPNLALGRLVAFVILAGFSYSLVTAYWVPIRRALGWLLLPLGTNSLRAYGVHLIMIVVVYNVDALASLYDRSRTANTLIQAVTVGLTFATVVTWRRLERGVAWRPAMPVWPVLPARPARLERRGAWVVATSLAVLFLTVAGTLLLGPVRGARQADLATAVAEADVLRYVPEGAVSADEVPVLLALHPEGQNGPQFATPLVDIARANGWALIAPTVPYGDWSVPEEATADSVHTLPRVRAVLDAIGDNDTVRFRDRVLLVASGRGAHAAHQFALAYPESVSAIASTGPAPCILPAQEIQAGSEAVELPFPSGVYDLEQYVGAPWNRDALRQVAFWIGVIPDATDPISSCPWRPLAEREPPERAQLFAELLSGIGARTQTVVLHPATDADPPLAEAMAFLRGVEELNER